MVGVQDEEACPQCGAMAFTEFQTRTFEFWMTCFECGYHKHITTLTDRMKQKRIAAEVKKLVGDNKMMEAAKLLGREDWVKPEGCGWKEIGGTPLGDWLMSEGERIQWFKMSKNNKIIQRGHERKGYGAYVIPPKDGAIGQSGTLPANKKQRDSLIRKLHELKSEGYDVKLFVFEDGAKKEVI